MPKGKNATQNCFSSSDESKSPTLPNIEPNIEPISLKESEILMQTALDMQGYSANSFFDPLTLCPTHLGNEKYPEEIHQLKEVVKEVIQQESNEQKEVKVNQLLFKSDSYLRA